jgi:heme-degrading monooxygenase HmoA
MSEHVIEWAAFALKPGVAESALMEASRRLQEEFLDQQPGYLRRELVKEADGQYADLVWWSSLAAAEAAMAKTATSAACACYFDLIEIDLENPAAGVKHLRSMAQY